MCRGIGRHERGANLRALKRPIPHLGRAATDRRVPAVRPSYGLSSSAPQTEVYRPEERRRGASHAHELKAALSAG